MNIIGIESSCDETAVGIICSNKLLSNKIASQEFHKKYGGVIPELSSRAHLKTIVPLVKAALNESQIELSEVDVIGATAGPGLIGALLVGLTYAKGLSFSLGKPFIPVNHIEGHIFSGFLMDDKPGFPYLCLVVSGGHTLLLNVKSDLEIEQIGSTIDDAAGEAFDKVAKLLGMEYPGGPNIQKLALKGNENFVKFPVAKCKNDLDYSFSGVKTAVLRYVQSEFGNPGNIPQNVLPDIAASFQKAVVEALTRNVIKVLNEQKFKSVSLVGGVAANKAIQDRMREIANSYKLKFIVPKIEYCGDNGAMIAYRAEKLFLAGKKYSLNYNAFPSIKNKSYFT